MYLITCMWLWNISLRYHGIVSDRLSMLTKLSSSSVCELWLWSISLAKLLCHQCLNLLQIWWVLHLQEKQPLEISFQSWISFSSVFILSLQYISVSMCWFPFLQSSCFLFSTSVCRCVDFLYYLCSKLVLYYHILFVMYQHFIIYIYHLTLFLVCVCLWLSGSYGDDSDEEVEPGAAGEGGKGQAEILRIHEQPVIGKDFDPNRSVPCPCCCSSM